MDKNIAHDHAEKLEEHEDLDGKVSDGVTTLLTIAEEADPGAEDQDPPSGWRCSSGCACHHGGGGTDCGWRWSSG